MLSAVGRIYEYQGHLLSFFQLWNASTVFYECMLIFAKNISKNSPKIGNRASVGFTFQEEPQAKEKHILYDPANLKRAFLATQMIIKEKTKIKFNENTDLSVKILL